MWAIPLRLIKCKDHTQKKSPTNSILPLCKVLDTVGKDNPIKISNHAFTFRPIVREIKFLNRKNDAIANRKAGNLAPSVLRPRAQIEPA